jgi:hypothetical protein
VYCACGWRCHVIARKKNTRSKSENPDLSGDYRCTHLQSQPYDAPDNCAYTTSINKVDSYVWEYVKRVCAHPELVQQAIAKKLEDLEDQHAMLESEIENLKKQLDGIRMDRQWVITQARKHAITEDDMELQLGQLQLEEWSLSKNLDEHQAMVAAQRQIESLREWAANYLEDINEGITSLEIRIDQLTAEQFEAFYTQIEAWRFVDKFPGDRYRQLEWAIIEEKRRIGRTLIDRVIVGKSEENGRDIKPILALEIPVQSADGSASAIDSSIQSGEFMASSDWCRK